MKEQKPDNQIPPFSYFYPHFYGGQDLKNRMSLLIAEGTLGPKLMMEPGQYEIPRDMNYFRYKDNLLMILSKLESEDVSDLVLAPLNREELPASAADYPALDLKLNRNEILMIYIGDGRIFANKTLLDSKQGMNYMFDIIEDVYNSGMTFRKLIEYGVKDSGKPQLKMIPGREYPFN